VSYLVAIYNQLYPDKEISHFPIFASPFKGVSIQSEVIRCTKNKAVVMAYVTGSAKTGLIAFPIESTWQSITCCVFKILN